MKKKFISLLFFFLSPVNLAYAQDFSKLSAVTERAIIECYSDLGEYTIPEIETAVNKARYSDHSFDEYDKFVLNQVISNEENKRKTKNKWLKTQKGKKAVSIAKLYFNNECLIDQKSAKQMALMLKPLISDMRNSTKNNTSIQNSEQSNNSSWKNDVEEILDIAELVLRGFNILNGFGFL